MKFDFWASGGQGFRSGPFEGDFAFMFFIFSAFFLFLLCFFQKKFHCWHQYQNLTVDVSSVVGAPWRFGVLTT